MNNSVDNSIKNPSTGLTINSIGMEFVLISAGEFYMGSPTREKRRKLWESPVHRVAIKKPEQISGDAGAVAGGNGRQSFVFQG